MLRVPSTISIVFDEITIETLFVRASLRPFKRLEKNVRFVLGICCTRLESEVKRFGLFLLLLNSTCKRTVREGSWFLYIRTYYAPGILSGHVV